MNLRDLRYLVAVAEKRHFGQAAKQCNVSQPTLSAQVKKLEQYLGVTIFERTNKSVSVTPIGEEIVSHARDAIEQADAIVALAQAARDPLAGPLRLGVIPTLGPYLMPLILGALTQKLPKLRLVLSEEITDRLLRRLADHEIDAALLASDVTDRDLETIPLFEEPFWLAYASGDPLGDLPNVTETDLQAAPLLLLSDGHCLRDQALALCGAGGSGGGGGDGSSPSSDLRAASLETILHLVSAGFGCTLVPALAIGGSWTTDMGIQTRPLELANGRRRVVLAYRRSFPRPAALMALAELVRERLPNTVKLLGGKPAGGRVAANSATGSSAAASRAASGQRASGQRADGKRADGQRAGGPRAGGQPAVRRPAR